MEKIAILCFSDFTREPRVLRTIAALSKYYDLDIYSTGESFPNVKVFDISSKDKNFNSNGNLLLSSRIFNFIERKFLGYQFGSKKYFERLYWNGGRKEILDVIKNGGYKLVIGHGIYSLPILAELNCPTIFNAHEYYEREFEENTAWKTYTQPFYTFIIKTYISKISLMFCVCESIQREYLMNYQVKSIVITNATKYNELEPTDVHEPIRIIHHGAALRARELERMAEMIKLLGSNYHLTFMLVKSDEKYYDELVNKYGSSDLIRFVEPVPVNDIARYCNNFDIGLFILPPVNYNWEHALPNKLFEFVQARLALAVSPNPNMKLLVGENNLGVIADDYSAESMASAIKNLNKTQIQEYKRSSHKNAKRLCAEENDRLILKSVNELISNSCAA